MNIPEPILRLRQSSAIRMLHSFDHSGEEMSRKRQHADAMGGGGGGTNGGKSNNNGGHDAENDDELKEQVSKMFCKETTSEEGDDAKVDPPARERPAVSSKI